MCYNTCSGNTELARSTNIKNLRIDDQNKQVVFLFTTQKKMESLGELKKGMTTLPCRLIVPTAFLVLPNSHLCLYNLIETQ